MAIVITLDTPDYSDDPAWEEFLQSHIVLIRGDNGDTFNATKFEFM